MRFSPIRPGVAANVPQLSTVGQALFQIVNGKHGIIALTPFNILAVVWG